MLMWWYNIEPVLKYVVDDKPSSNSSLTSMTNMSSAVNASRNPVR